jgi:hypothetical protein
METKVALLVIYNHRYDKNIPIINKLYEGKFSYIYHIVPFYDGDKENVIPVYDSSYYFQNYVAQAYTHLKNKGFTHFLAVADDMIVNLHINENTLWSVMGIKKNDCFIPRLNIMQERKFYWKWTIFAQKYEVEQDGVEVSNILPTVQEARKRFDYHHLPYGKLLLHSFIPFVLTRECIIQSIRGLFHSHKLNYPLVGSYTDIFLIRVCL